MSKQSEIELAIGMLQLEVIEDTWAGNAMIDKVGLEVNEVTTSSVSGGVVQISEKSKRKAIKTLEALIDTACVEARKSTLEWVIDNRGDLLAVNEYLAELTNQEKSKP